MEKESICKRCKHAIRCCDMILDDNDDDYCLFVNYRMSMR